MSALCAAHSWTFRLGGDRRLVPCKAACQDGDFRHVSERLHQLGFSYTVPLLLSDQDAGWGDKIGLLLAGLSLACILPVYFLYPETKVRTYAEIDELYESGIPPRKFAETKTTAQLIATGSVARV